MIFINGMKDNEKNTYVPVIDWDHVFSRYYYNPSVSDQVIKDNMYKRVADFMFHFLKEKHNVGVASQFLESYLFQDNEEGFSQQNIRALKEIQDSIMILDWNMFSDFFNDYLSAYYKKLGNFLN